MRVLVVGGTESLSFHLVRALRRDGHDVTVLNRGRRPDVSRKECGGSPPGGSTGWST